MATVDWSSCLQQDGLVVVRAAGDLRSEVRAELESRGLAVRIATEDPVHLALSGLADGSWCFVPVAVVADGGLDRLDVRRIRWAMALAGRSDRVIVQVHPGVPLDEPAAVAPDASLDALSGAARVTWVEGLLRSTAELDHRRALEAVLRLGDQAFARRLDSDAQVPPHPGVPVGMPDTEGERAVLRARLEAWIAETTDRTGHPAHAWNVAATVCIAQTLQADQNTPQMRARAQQALGWGLRVAPESIHTQLAWRLSDVEPPAATRWGAELLVRQADHARAQHRMGQAHHAAAQVMERGPASVQSRAAAALKRIDAAGGSVPTDATELLEQIWSRLAVDGRSSVDRSLCAVLLQRAAADSGVALDIEPPLARDALAARHPLYGALLDALSSGSPPVLEDLSPIEAYKVLSALERLATAGAAGTRSAKAWLGKQSGRSRRSTGLDRTRWTRAILSAVARHARSEAEQAASRVHEDLHVHAEPLAVALLSMGWSGPAGAVVDAAEQKMEPLSRLHALAAQVQRGSRSEGELSEALEGIANRSREATTTVVAELDILRAAAVFRVRYIEGEPWAYLDRLLDHLPRATDTFSTNSHFSLALLTLVDALAAATVEAVTERRVDLPALAVPVPGHPGGPVG